MISQVVNNKPQLLWKQSIRRIPIARGLTSLANHHYVYNTTISNNTSNNNNSILRRQQWKHIQSRSSSPSIRLFSSSAIHHNSNTSNNLTEEEQEILNEERAVDKVDVCIVGGGPAGLATAIKLKQLDESHGNGDLRVVVLEKASDMGAHILSGAVIEPRALRELFPDSEHYDENGEGIPLPAELVTKVTKDSMKFLIDDYALPIPEPPQMINEGRNYIVSLNQVVKHLAEVAESLGVEIYPGIAVSEIIYEEGEDGNKNAVKGIATKDMGISKTGKPKDTFERGMEFHAKVTVFGEGCHGSLSKQVIKQFNLREGRDNQTYGIGVKEVWEVKPENFKKGLVAHSMGYPLNNTAYGGGFMYHFGDGLVTVGLVVGLDYENPWISPYQEFQLMKHHPFYAEVLEGGKCISYGARALNEGGLQSVPKLYFPGGVLVGASAGFMNVPKIKGTHTAMKSGMLAAENIYEAIKDLPRAAEEMEEDEEYDEAEEEEQEDEQQQKPLVSIPPVKIDPIVLESYEKAVKNSWIYEELDEVRNIRPSFNSPFGLYGGLAYSGLEAFILRGRTSYTLHHHKSDASCTKPASLYNKIEYPKPDGKISFDILTSVSRTGTYHDEDEQCHLRVNQNTKEDLQKHTEKSFPVYQGVENRFCPAGVYEYVPVEDETADTAGKEDKTVQKGQKVKFQINSQNCIHCKTCDIKVPDQDINWTVPEGGGGPKYYMT